jgi:hypothetical protein
VVAQLVAPRAANDVLVEDVRAPRRDADRAVRRARERLVVASGDRAPALGPRAVVMDELVAQDRSRRRRQLRVVAELRAAGSAAATPGERHVREEHDHVMAAVEHLAREMRPDEPCASAQQHASHRASS